MIAAVLASFFLSTNATPAEIVASCRSMVPANVELRGSLILRNRRGVVMAEHTYVLTRTNSTTRLEVDGKRFDPPSENDAARDSICGTDVSWSDVSLDYLWWDDFSFDAEREGETIHGRKCMVLLMRTGGRTVRAWVDRKTGSLMQAEELVSGKPVRRMWGTRVKKFGERWMANVMEVETIGSGHRTKIKVEELK